MVLESPLLLYPQQATGQCAFRRLTFVPATKPDAHSAPVGVDLIPLNEAPQMPSLPGAAGPGPSQGFVPAAPKQQREIFRESDVVLNWTTVRNRGAGLQNLGNTCFMNSVLQALAHTPPLAELFLSTRGEKLLAEISSGGSGSYDPVAVTLQHVRRCFSNLVMAPKAHAQSLRLVNKRFRLGRQEDSHEFLRCLLDAMHEACLKRFKPKPPLELATTTFVYRIFGGKLRSQIVCDGVDYVSRTYDPFLDLSLEINRAANLERALGAFTAPEILDGANKYRCPKNNKLVRATKRISVEEAPNVLTVHLKRFEYGGFGAKINKKVEFGTQLDLRPYMSNTDGPKQLYDLYGVLVHHGHSVNSGHYICYVKAANGLWHVCDDHRVTAVGEGTVLDQRAYILFYIRRHPRNAAAAAAAVQQAVQGGMRAVTASAEQARPGSSSAAPAAAAAAAPPATGGGEAPERPAKRAKAQPIANTGQNYAKANAPRIAAVANGSSRVAAPNSALALMLANLAEAGRKEEVAITAKQQPQPQQLVLPKLKAQQLKQASQQQQRQEDEDGQPGLQYNERRSVQQDTATGSGTHVDAAKGKFGAKAVATNGECSQEGAAAQDAAQAGEEQKQEQEQRQEDRSPQVLPPLRLANGKDHLRPSSALKGMRPSPLMVSRINSVWYAASGLLRHAANPALMAANGHHHQNGTSTTTGTPSLTASRRAAAAGVVVDTPRSLNAGEAVLHAAAESLRSRAKDLPPKYPGTACNGHAEPESGAAAPAATGRSLKASGLGKLASGHGPIRPGGQPQEDSGPGAQTAQVGNGLEGPVGRKRAKRFAAMLAQGLEELTGGAAGVLQEPEDEQAAPIGVKRRRREQEEAAVTGQFGNGSAIVPAANAAVAADGLDEKGRNHKPQQVPVVRACEARAAPGEKPAKPSKQPRHDLIKSSEDASTRPTTTAVTPAKTPAATATPATAGTEGAAGGAKRQQPSVVTEEVINGHGALAWLTGGGEAGVNRKGRVLDGNMRHCGRGDAEDGSRVDTWGTADDQAELRRQAGQLNRAVAGLKRRTPIGGRDYDKWDEEYDMGRTKKIRNKRNADEDGDEDGFDEEVGGRGGPGSLLRSGANMFQKAAIEGWRSDQSRPRNSSGGSDRGRGRGRGRGWGSFGGGRGSGKGGRGAGRGGGRGSGRFSSRGRRGGRGRGRG